VGPELFLLQRYRSGIRADQAGDDLHERRLARAVVPDQADDLPLLDREIKAIERAVPYCFTSP
jgi:hypothetical protein